MTWEEPIRRNQLAYIEDVNNDSNSDGASNDDSDSEVEI